MGTDTRPTDLDPRALTYLVFPAGDLPNTWVAHCLEIDVVSQGDDPTHALKNAEVAVAATIEFTRDDGGDLFGRAAPDELWPSDRLAAWKARCKGRGHLQIVTD